MKNKRIQIGKKCKYFKWFVAYFFFFFPLPFLPLPLPPFLPLPPLPSPSPSSCSSKNRSRFFPNGVFFHQLYNEQTHSEWREAASPWTLILLWRHLLPPCEYCCDVRVQEWNHSLAMDVWAFSLDVVQSRFRQWYCEYDRVRTNPIVSSRRSCRGPVW